MNRVVEAVHTPATPFDRAARPTRRAALVVAFLLACLPFRRGQAENRAAYRYEDYLEDGDRMRVRTHSVWFEYDLHQKAALRGQYVNDAISGATPTGGPGVPGGGVETVFLEDKRNAGFIETALRLGRSTTTPQIAYSEESDYRSLGLALTEAIEFNQRNTTVSLGVAHNNDAVRGFWQPDFRSKRSTDVLVGLNQILGPRTFMTLNLTFGYAEGYLTDPYKGVNVSFDLPPFGPYDPRNPGLDASPYVTNGPESRPRERFRQVLLGTLSHHFDRLRAGVELSQRVHRDDWGIWSGTSGLTWNQRIGRRLLVSTLLRYHYQTAADFYVLSVPGDRLLGGTRVAFQGDLPVAVEGDGVFESVVLADPGAYDIVTVPPTPAHYSADYRLSELHTFTFGIGMAVELHERVTLDLAYKRYLMRGLDGRTSADAYPDANVFTVGLTGHF